MTTTATDLREKRANAWAQMTEVMDRASNEGRDLTTDEQTIWDNANSDMDSLEAQINRIEAHANRKAEMERVDRGELGPQDVDEKGNVKAEATKLYKNAFDSWMKYGHDALDNEHRQTLRDGWVDGSNIKNAAGVATGAAGGYTVPAEYRNEIIERLRYVSSVRTVADGITTDTGANLPWPTVDDTNNIGAILGENTAVTEQDVTFGTNSIDAYMYTSKMVRVSLQLLQDAGFDVPGWLKKALATRIGRIQNMHFTTGTGINQPDGVVTGAQILKTGAAGQLTTITYEDLIDLADGLDPAYLGTTDGGAESNLRWMMNQTLRKAVRKIKDGQGRPLWEPSIQVGTPDTLIGYGITLNNDMPSPGANAKSLLFGDYREGYLVRDVKDFFLMRMNERYGEFLQAAFVGFQRTDATVQNQYAYGAFQHPAA